MKRIALALAALTLAVPVAAVAAPADAAVHAPSLHDTTWGCPGC